MLFYATVIIWQILSLNGNYTEQPSVDYYWTSGKFSNNGWEWASAEPFQPMTYTNWYTGEPSHSQTGSFAYINFNFDDTGFWFDEIGSSSYILFICESIDGGTAETTTTSTTTDTLTTTTQISTTQTTTVTDYTTSTTTAPGASKNKSSRDYTSFLDTIWLTYKCTSVYFNFSISFKNEVCPYFEGTGGRCYYWNEKCYCFTPVRNYSQQRFFHAFKLKCFEYKFLLLSLFNLRRCLFSGRKEKNFARAKIWPFWLLKPKKRIGWYTKTLKVGQYRLLNCDSSINVFHMILK